MNVLSERQLACLRGLERHGGWSSAANVCSYLWQRDLMPDRARYSRDAGARGVATTLRALEQRGLVRSEPGYQRAYELTAEGREALMLDEDHEPTKIVKQRSWPER